MSVLTSSCFIHRRTHTIPFHKMVTGLLLPCLLCLGWLGSPLAVPGQSVEEENSEKLESTEKVKPSTRKPDLDKVVNRIVQRTNAFRQEKGREPVRQEDKLTKTARYFARYMARTDEYGHTADGTRPSERARNHGYKYCIISENIAYAYHSKGFTTEELTGQFVTGWKESPGHRENMLNSAVTETGVAVAHSENTGHYYAVQMFGRPRSAAIQFKISNQANTSIQYQMDQQKFSLPPRYTRTHRRCRSSAVVFPFSSEKDGGKTKSKTMSPKTGDHFVIQGKKDSLQVKRK